MSVAADSFRAGEGDGQSNPLAGARGFLGP